MKTYIINLEKDNERKVYMQKIMQEQHIEDVVFVNAVYGKNLSLEEKEKMFDSAKFLKNYAKKPNDAQIGCTLSHRKCLEEFTQSEDKCCLILEDDIEPKGEIVSVVKEIQKFLEAQNEPTIVLLSGWFWYTKKITSGAIKLGRLYSGYLSHSYMLNALGSKFLLSKKPYFVADDWYEFKKLGIKVYGVIPHVLNQKWDETFSSSTNSLAIVYEKHYCFTKIKIYWRALIQRFLKIFGGFENIA